MEKKILKWSLAILTVLTVVTIAFLYFFPAAYARLRWGNQSGKLDLLDPALWSGMAKIKEAPIDPGGFLDQSGEPETGIAIEIPDDAARGRVTVENDYLTQTVYVKFPTGCKDYFKEYRMSGRGDYISSISYRNVDGVGTLTIGLSRLYESEVQFATIEQKLNIVFHDPHDLYDKVIVVDAGHGGRRVGAEKNGILEKDLNLAVVEKLKKRFLEERGKIGVYYTRLDDRDPSFSQRVGLANAARADLFISVHHNSSKDGRFTSVRGTQVLYSGADKSEFSGERLANICLEQVTAACGSQSVGLLNADNIYILRNSRVPAALIEVGFMTNREELQQLCDVEYQEKAAEGIYNAIKAAIADGF